MKVLDEYHVAVDGPDKSIDILLRRDLSVMQNLDTNNQLPFSCLLNGNKFFVGCNQGYLFCYDKEHQF